MAMIIVDTNDLRRSIERSFNKTLAIHAKHGAGGICIENATDAKYAASLVSCDLVFDNDFQKRYPGDRQVSEIMGEKVA